MTTPVILIGSDATPTYNENAAPVVLDNSLALSDADAPAVGADIGSATVTITGGFIAGDVLAADATGTAIAVSYSNGVLTLSGADTLADYQAVLKTITFQSSSDNPTDWTTFLFLGSSEEDSEEERSGGGGRSSDAETGGGGSAAAAAADNSDGGDGGDAPA